MSEEGPRRLLARFTLASIALVGFITSYLLAENRPDLMGPIALGPSRSPFLYFSSSTMVFIGSAVVFAIVWLSAFLYFEYRRDRDETEDHKGIVRQRRLAKLQSRIDELSAQVAAQEQEKSELLTQKAELLTENSELESRLTAELEQLKDELILHKQRAVSFTELERARLREEVENDWRREKQSEIDRKYNHYLRIQSLNQSLTSAFETAQRLRGTRLGELEIAVTELWPHFEQRHDPSGSQEMAKVQAKFVKDLSKKFKDIGLLRESQNPDVVEMVGGVHQLPPAPPPPSPPLLLPMPADLAKQFGSL